MSGVRKSLHDAIHFAARIAHEFPDLGPVQIADHAEALIRLGTRFGKMCEDDCNHGLSERQERAAERLREKIKTVCGQIGAGCVPVFSGDPRGATVKLKLPSGYSDSWGGEGLCVPGS